ncbi:MAG: 50S ribosomal protein L9, partial [Gammaproteobacteria bacterium]|nr:50S ribosomal protein L9 [Gammaproteobacteria bacterium]
MNVILLEPINRLGDLGDEVAVKPGFARNYLLPQGKAVRATAENRELFEQRRAELQKLAEARLAEAGDRGRQLAAANLTIVVKAGDEGRLYGSVGALDIANARAEQGIE